MKLYELNYLLPTHFTPQDQKNISQGILALLQKQEAVILEEKNALAQKLAYPIKRQSTAFLITISFKADPAKINAIEEGLRSENKILRFYLLTKKTFLARKEKKEEKKEGKVELKEIDRKLKEIFGE